MAKELQQEEAYYYDLHPTGEDLVGESSLHADLVSYLMAVLRWQFHDQACAVYENLNFYQTTHRREYPLAPDIAVIKGVERRKVISWKIDQNHPAPGWSSSLLLRRPGKRIWSKSRSGMPRWASKSTLPTIPTCHPS